MESPVGLIMIIVLTILNTIVGSIVLLPKFARVIGIPAGVHLPGIINGG